MAKVTIQALDNAPYVVKGETELLDGQGNVIKTEKELHLCRCGLTKNAPDCDGSHQGKYQNEVRAK
ncbi:MAG: CDGSH iron-sulfur domain-containing protein [Clostridiales bacterium]|nr:CDGSH iron-sulfur domain-containing protein [Clostridiales bacterium]